MMETDLSPIHSLPCGLCEDPTREATVLIGRMAKAEIAALTDLYGMWSPVFLGVACRMLGDRRDAEDVVQDTFERLWREAAQYDAHQVPPFVWGFSVLRGQCVDRLRARGHPKRESPREPSLSSPVSPERSETPRVMAMDDFRRVRCALDQLPPDERSSLEVAVFLGFSPNDATDHPGSSTAITKNRLRQALKKVRNQLSRYEL
ncbi:MAG: hypothetical protein RLZZ282_1811 [Verrucomicrobiota bacterium]